MFYYESKGLYLQEHKSYPTVPTNEPDSASLQEHVPTSKLPSATTSAEPQQNTSDFTSEVFHLKAYTASTDSYRRKRIPDHRRKEDLGESYSYTYIID